MAGEEVVDTTLDQELEEQVTQLIVEAGLTKPDNGFFIHAKSVDDVEPTAALRVALQWQSMTRAFMFTTMAGIGTLSAKLATGPEPSREVLGAVQTAFSVIGDDLANLAPEFAAVSPDGADGVHYVWWADTIVGPLVEALGPGAVETGHSAAVSSQGVSALIANMERLASAPLGAAVQLRVVEAIALDIAVAFRRLFSKVTLDGNRPYKEDGALDWVDSHIKAETSHAASVSHDETGMTVMVTTPEDQQEFLVLVEEYVANWAMALDDFDKALVAAQLDSATAV